MNNWLAESDSGKFLLGNLRVCTLIKPKPLLIVFLVSLFVAPVFLNCGSSVKAQTEQGVARCICRRDVAY